MTMKIINVAEATGPALDWLVDNIEGVKNYGVKDWLEQRRYGNDTRYSTNWAQGGPIIDRHNISVIRVYKDYPQPWLATHGEFIYMNADTPLIAAMRCRVVSKLGPTAEVPEELCVPK